jgi:rRNA-processing protein FCF1
MKQIILDTNFILTCIKQKIDFFEEIKLMGTQIIIPKQVIDEIKKIANSKKKNYVRENAKLSLKLLGKNKFRKMDLGKGHVDKKIIDYTKNNKDIVVATLDKELKNKIKNPKLVIRGKKKLEVV